MVVQPAKIVLLPLGLAVDLLTKPRRRLTHGRSEPAIRKPLGLHPLLHRHVSPSLCVLAVMKHNIVSFGETQIEMLYWG